MELGQDEADSGATHKASRHQRSDLARFPLCAQIIIIHAQLGKVRAIPPRQNEPSSCASAWTGAAFCGVVLRIILRNGQGLLPGDVWAQPHAGGHQFDAAPVAGQARDEFPGLVVLACAGQRLIIHVQACAELAYLALVQVLCQHAAQFGLLRALAWRFGRGCVGRRVPRDPWAQATANLDELSEVVPSCKVLDQ